MLKCIVVKILVFILFLYNMYVFRKYNNFFFYVRFYYFLGNWFVGCGEFNRK